MDPYTIGVQDSAMQMLSSTNAALAGTYVAGFTSATFDLAQGATLVNGQYSPGAGGAALQVPIPILGYNAPNTLTVTATGGTYTLSINGSSGVQTTTALAYGATATSIATALNALPCVTATGLAVTVTGAGPFTITLPPALQAFGNQVNPLTLSVANLSGGTGGGATLTLPTFSFATNESSDQVTWRPVSAPHSVAQHNISPAGDAYVMLMTQSRQRYLQLVLTVTTPAGSGPAIQIGNVFIQPFVNRFGG